MPTLDYRIVTAEIDMFMSLREATESLVREVERALAVGWEPIGGVAICPDPNVATSTYHRAHGYLLQTLVKRSD